MTLQVFLTLTATTPVPELRRALTVALVAERPSSGEAYPRFYRRVMAELAIASDPSRDQASRHAVLASVLEQGALDTVAGGWLGLRL